MPFVATHGRLTAASLKRPGLVAGQTRPTVSSRDPHFHARARSGAPHLYARARSGSPIFNFAAAHTYQNLGWMPHLPPPPPSMEAFGVKGDNEEDKGIHCGNPY